MSELKIKFHGVLATKRGHSAVEASAKETNILIQPTVKIPNITAAIITDIDEDEYFQWKYYRDNKIPIYSTEAIKRFIPDKELSDYITSFKEKTKIGNLSILAVKVPESPHHPMMGIKIPAYDVVIAPELPPYLGQSFIETIGLPPAHLIAGVGSFSKSNHKISFQDFREQLERARKGKEKGILSLVLTNFRKDILMHKQEVIQTLKRDWDIPILLAEKGMELVYSGRVVKEKELLEKKVEKRDGKWCVIHCSGPKIGQPIKCYPGTKDGYKKAMTMHRAIMAQKYKDLDNEELADLVITSVDINDDELLLASLKEVALRKETENFDFTLRPKSLSPTAYELWKKIKKRLNNKEITLLLLKPVHYQKLKAKILLEREITFGYKSKSKPYYRFELPTIHDDIKHMCPDKELILIDLKCDGLRVTLSKIKGEARLFVDPEDLKRKSPDISNRVPGIIRDAEKILPDNTILDGELYAGREDDAQHRTVINGIINSKFSAEKLIPFVYLFAFDILFYKGKDIRDYPLNKRSEYLKEIKSTEHIKIQKTSANIVAGFQGFIVSCKNKESIDKAIRLVLGNKHGLHRNIQEGVMIKRMDGVYEIPTNHGWAKAKELYEVDTIAYDRNLVKGQTDVWNYLLAINVSKDYSEKLPSKIKLELDGSYYMKFGKSDNTKVDIKPSPKTVLRVASEEVNKFENEEFPEAPWYRGYISIAMQPVPEKDISDSLTVLEKLSQFQPKRISIEKLLFLAGKSLPSRFKNIRIRLDKISDEKLIALWNLLKHDRTFSKS